MNFSIINSLDKVQSYASKWSDLLAKSTCHQTFSSPEWFINTIQAFPELTPNVIVAQINGELRGIAPCVINAEQRLMFASDLADYQDIIIERDDRDTATFIFEKLLTENTMVRSIKLSGLSQNANLNLALQGRPRSEIQKIEQCFFSDLSDGYEVFMAAKSANFRSNLRRIHRRAEERDIEICELTPLECNGDDVVDTFLRLHLKRFPDKLFSRDKAQRFCYLNLAEQFDRRSLRVFALLDQRLDSNEIKDKIIALNLSVCDTLALGIWNSGFDPHYSKISPGKLLIHKQIQTCCDEGLSGFDFLRGDEVYKQDWSTSSRALSEFNA